jgi:hypothetical protein
MKRRNLNFLLMSVWISIIFAVIFAISCSDKSTNPPEAASVSTLADIRNAGASLTGWTEDPAAYKFLPDSQSFDVEYDGAVSRYVFNSKYYPAFRTIFNDTVINVDTVIKTLECFAIVDDNTPATATAFYNKILTLASEYDASVKYTVPGFDASTAIGNQIGGGITVWAHFKQFYFKLILTGYLDSQIATAAADIAAILTTFRSTIK